ncbi:MAG: AAA family ATPase [Microgenomates group bacterium]
MDIIGIVGPLACGKGVVADYLIKNYGYTSFSLSFIVHDEVRKRGIMRFDRTVLQDIGDELRKKEGDGVLAKRAMLLLASDKKQKIIIEGIRNPGEVEYLRTIPGFFLVAVDSLQEVRFRRVIERGKPWDPKDWETFLKVDGRDSVDKKNMSGQQVQACMKLADVHLTNNTDLTQFYGDIEKAFISRRPLRTEY